MVVAVVIAGIKLLLEHGRRSHFQMQVSLWTAQRDHNRRLADDARSRADSAAAAKMDERAASAEGRRRVYQHLLNGGRRDNVPPIPKDPDWPPGRPQAK